MIEWIVAIGITAAVVFLISPKKNSHVWLGAFTPLSYAIIYVIALSMLSSGYKAGLATTKLIYPVLVSGFVIYFLLRNKFKNGKVKTWILITSLLILLLFATPTIISFFLKKDIDNSLKIINTANKKNNVKNEIIPEVKKQDIEIDNTFNKHGLSFKYESWWVISDNVELEGQLFKIVCQNRKISLEFLIIMWTPNIISPEEFLSGIIEELKTNEFYKQTVFLPNLSLYEDSASSTYQNWRIALDANNKAKVVKDFYGEIESYNRRNMTVLTIKQSDKEEKLVTIFKTIEGSMKFED